MNLPVAFGWRDVLFASWPVEPDLVAAHVPDALDVDTFDGSAWLSVVPFVNVETRLRGLPRALGFTLPELNLRTYVTHRGEPGVYFHSLDADGLLGVTAARLFHHLPYYRASIDYRPGGRSASDPVHFRSERRHPGARPVRFDATYAPTGDGHRPSPGSRAHFLVERYRYYTQAPDGSLRYAAISHDPWTLHDASADMRASTLFEANGYAEPDGSPVLHYSPGLDVTATGSRRVD